MEKDDIKNQLENLNISAVAPPSGQQLKFAIINSRKRFFELKTENNGNSKSFPQTSSHSESLQSAFAKIDSMPD